MAKEQSREIDSLAPLSIDSQSEGGREQSWGSFSLPVGRVGKSLRQINCLKLFPISLAETVAWSGSPISIAGYFFHTASMKPLLSSS